MKLKLIFFATLTAFLIPVSVLAATFSVRIGQPKTPTNQNNFKLTFVALDTQTSGRNITVKCFKKGPSDGGYSQFDTEKILIEGGNTDYCNVTSSILNSNGTYSFYVTAEVPSEPLLTSTTVLVDYNNSSPSTPISYSKERLNDCDYKIKFKTADDGRTFRVELYRSDSLSISIDSGHLVTTQNIGPNSEGSFTNSVPTCGKEYYFAIRAVDSSDNVSGITGDSFTKVIIEGSTTTTGTTTQQQALLAEGSQVTEGTTVEDTETTITPPDETPSTESGTPEVLGIQKSKWDSIRWLSIPLILIATFFFLKSKKRA